MWDSKSSVAGGGIGTIKREGSAHHEKRSAARSTLSVVRQIDGQFGAYVLLLSGTLRASGTVGVQEKHNSESSLLDTAKAHDPVPGYRIEVGGLHTEVPLLLPMRILPPNKQPEKRPTL